MIGSIANNRFLQRVNPEILRALNETGAAASMRQMVDLDIAKNLVGWWHRDNVNTRVSGSDTFVTSALDSSGGTNNATQATEANQPKLVSLGMDFDGSNDEIVIGNTGISFSNEISICLWHKVNTIQNATLIMSFVSDYTLYRINIHLPWGDSNIYWDCGGNGSVNQYDRHIVAWDAGYSDISFWVFQKNKTTGTMEIYRNGISIASTSGKTQDIPNLNNLKFSASTRLSAVINDIRIYNKTLSATEIAAIDNQTKGYYGL